MGGFICFYMSDLSNYISMHGPINSSDSEIKPLRPNLRRKEGNWWFVELTKAGRKTSYTEASDQKKVKCDNRKVTREMRKNKED